MHNIFAIPDRILPKELISTLYEQDKIRIERIVSTGQTTEWLDQCEAEWVTLLTGQATIAYLDGRVIKLQAGDCIYIAPHEVHRVDYTSSSPACIWLCFFWPEDVT